MQEYSPPADCSPGRRRRAKPGPRHLESRRGGESLTLIPRFPFLCVPAKLFGLLLSRRAKRTSPLLPDDIPKSPERSPQATSPSRFSRRAIFPDAELEIGSKALRSSLKAPINQHNLNKKASLKLNPEGNEPGKALKRAPETPLPPSRRRCATRLPPSRQVFLLRRPRQAVDVPTLQFKSK